MTFTGIVMLAFYRKRWKQLCPSDYELAFYFSFACVAMIPLVIYSSVAGDRIGYYLMPIGVDFRPVYTSSQALGSECQCFWPRWC